MINLVRKSANTSAAIISAAALTLMIALAAPLLSAKADEASAKSLFKAMSDYMVAQKAISFSYDTNLEIVTKDEQKLALASSGAVILNRPDHIRVTRQGGFADVEAVFDGKTLTLLGKNANLYGQVDAVGSIDHLIEELRDKYHRPVPGADLLQSNLYEEMMPSVTDTKDLGSGVIGGVECDHLAFRPKKLIGRFGLHRVPVPIRADMSSHRNSLPMDRNTASRSGTGRPEMKLHRTTSASRMQRMPKRWI